MTSLYEAFAAWQAAPASRERVVVLEAEMRAEKERTGKTLNAIHDELVELWRTRSDEA